MYSLTKRGNSTESSANDWQISQDMTAIRFDIEEFIEEMAELAENNPELQDRLESARDRFRIDEDLR